MSSSIWVRSIIVVSLLLRVGISATIPTEIKKVVTFIFLADAKGNLLIDERTKSPVPNGTGFFVFIKNETGGPGGYGYLITAKHVLKSSDGKEFSTIYVRLNRLKGDAEFVRVNLAQSGRNIIYTHADPTVDIAVVPALPSLSVYDYKAIPEEMLTAKASFGDLNIAEGSDVFFTGLFVSHYGDHHNNPIVRFGRVAMLPEDRIAWQEEGKPLELVELYLLETQSYGGNSGSPVFFSLGADRNPGSIVVGPPVIKLAGIMRGSFNENRRIAIVHPVAADAIPVSLQNVGIAAVTPSYLLHEVLFSTTLKKLRSENPIVAPNPK